MRTDAREDSAPWTNTACDPICTCRYTPPPPPPPPSCRPPHTHPVKTSIHTALLFLCLLPCVYFLSSLGRLQLWRRQLRKVLRLLVKNTPLWVCHEAEYVPSLQHWLDSIENTPRLSHLPQSVDDLLVGKLNASRVSGLVVHVETEHLPVDQVNLRFQI